MWRTSPPSSAAQDIFNLTIYTYIYCIIVGIYLYVCRAFFLRLYSCVNMKLLNAKTKKIREFSGSDVPPYAILSHTWGANEVTFADIQGAWPLYRRRESWKKIKWCCRQALQDGFEYVWVDTCCIDKSSSAELQEAINSMFRWYEMSQVCYAYLADVRPGEKPRAVGSSFRRSKWHTRGWTLQELIAPGLVLFFDSSWNAIGTRFSLRYTISSVTGIDRIILENSVVNARRAMRHTSIAQKMSWAAGRSTSRPEDIAYCLLGIFGVNMPMLYGEESNAFVRLQEEIMKNSHDQAILAWGFGRPVPTLWGASHALATSPGDFAGCSNLASFGVARPGDSFAMTQRGLELHLPMKDFDGNCKISYCLLNCATLGRDVRGGDRVLALPLLQATSLYQQLHDPNNLNTDEYIRMPLTTPLWVPADCLHKWPRRTVYLPKLQVYEQPATQSMRIKMSLHNVELPPEYFIAGIWPPAVAPNDLLEFVIERATPARCVLLHVAHASRSGYILAIRHSYRRRTLLDRSIHKPATKRQGDCSGSLKPDYIDRIMNTIRSIVAESLAIPVEELGEDMDLAQIGMDSLRSLEIISLIRKSTGLPVYSDTLLGCSSLRDVQRNIVLLSRAAPMADSFLVDDEGVNPWAGKKGIENAEFALIEVQPEMSLLDFAVDSADARQTWKDLTFETPSRVSKILEEGHHYEATLMCGSHQVHVLEAYLKAGRNWSELSFRLTSRPGEPDTF
ncbi:HET-domain-containing protein [Hypomontagnella submonticulosa]|nr:HET-domain-containing protein [Hypomontagnella submonticulosa]